jgi:DNA-binding NarL/FixJ family response regulator
MTTPRRATILLADDHSILTAGLVSLLQDRFDVIGTVADGNTLVEAAQRLHPDVIIADISMPSMSGLDALERLKKNGMDSKFIVLTMHSDPDVAARAMRAGAAGFLVKHTAGDELVGAIDEVLNGRVYLTPAVTRGVIENLKGHSSGHRVELTSRQRDVLRLIVDGRRMKEIGTILELSTRTVETHKYEMMRALGVQSTAALVRYALEHELA